MSTTPDRHPSSASRVPGRLVLQFVGLMLGVFLVLQQGYLWLNEHHDRFLTHTLNAVPAAALINGFTPGTRVRAEDGVLFHASGALSIHKGCEGFEAMILLIAAMAGFPMPLRQRFLGALSGTLFIYACNLLRIIGIYWVDAHAQRYTEIAHVLVGQSIMVVLIALYFLFWISRRAVAGSQSGAA